jgi:hypothetical protein
MEGASGRASQGRAEEARGVVGGGGTAHAHEQIAARLKGSKSRGFVLQDTVSLCTPLFTRLAR